VTLTGSSFRINPENTRIERRTGYGTEKKDVADISENKNKIFLYKCLKSAEIEIIRNALGKYQNQVEIVENF
jgi:hypothetical protein